MKYPRLFILSGNKRQYCTTSSINIVPKEVHLLKIRFVKAVIGGHLVEGAIIGLEQSG
jgi:hypothetical protein